MRILLMLMIFSATLVSCNRERDYTCQCTYTNDEGVDTKINVENFEMSFKSDDLATTNCKALNTKYAAFNTKGDCILLK